jgi:hypothetical protein
MSKARSLSLLSGKLSSSGGIDNTIIGANTAAAGTFTTVTGALIGNASTATALATGRTISLTGDVTYTSGSFDGSANVTGTATLANSGVTAGTYNNVATAHTPFTVDAKGRITSTGTAVTITPAWSSITGTPTTISGYGITDAYTKTQVDAFLQGLDPKASVIAATTTNITLSAPQTIDGVSVIAGDRVLVKNQTTTSQNGIYVVAAGAWTRALDMDIWAEVPGTYVFVEKGTLYADTGWVSTADIGGTIDTTAISWVQFAGAGTYTGTSPVTISGTTVSLANSGVTAGSYGSSTAVPVLTVDALGRVTSATTATISGSLTFTGDVTGTGSTGGSTALTLATVNANVGTFGSSTQIPTVTVNAKGLVTAVSTTAVSIPSGSISVTGGDLTLSGTTGTAITNATLAASGVTAGTYTKITVDAKGRATSGTTLTSADLPTYTGTISSSQVTTALGFTPYNSTNPNGYITSSSLSSYLPLSGGTLTGTIGNNQGDLGRLFASYNASASGPLQFFIDHSYGNVNIGNARGNINISSGSLLHGGNQVLHAGNYTSYSPSLSGSGASGTWGINVTGSAGSVSNFKSFGIIYINPNGANAQCNTAQMIAHLSSLGFFNQSHAVGKCAWDYAGNNDLNDTGFGTIDLAGCMIETATTTGGEKHIRITRPTTGAGGFQVLVYVDHGSGYSPGWRAMITSENISSFALGTGGGSTVTSTTYFRSSDNGSTSYTAAAIQLRESQGGSSGSYLPPRLAFHWGGVVASQIGIRSDGGIQILNNPGSSLENLWANNMYASGFQQNSDIRIKDNIVDSKYGLKEVLQLRSVEYDRKDDGKHQVGLIAQEVEKIIPEFVNTTDAPISVEDADSISNFKTVNYSQMVSVLIKAVQELKAEVDDLRSKLGE